MRKLAAYTVVRLASALSWKPPAHRVRELFPATADAAARNADPNLDVIMDGDGDARLFLAGLWLSGVGERAGIGFGLGLGQRMGEQDRAMLDNRGAHHRVDLTRQHAPIHVEQARGDDRIGRR